MNDTARYDNISTIEALAAEQHLHYSFDNGLVTFSTPDGEKSFNWLDASGVPDTLRWLKAVSAYNALDELLKKQYTNMHGPFVATSDFTIGETISTHDNVTGEIIWVYQSGRDIMYCIDAQNAMPIAVHSYEVRR